MEAKELFEKLKKELPEFIWNGDYEYGWYNGYYFVNEFSIENNEISIECCPPLFIKAYLEIANIKEANNEIEDGVFVIESEEDLDLFIKAARLWMERCDSLRKSDRNEKQIILIHPDLYELSVPKFLKDFDYIYTDPDNSDLRIGVMDARKWDFSKEELVDAISDNTASCFSIQPSDLEFVEDSCIWPESFMQDFYNKYPEARDIKEKYETDWD